MVLDTLKKLDKKGFLTINNIESSVIDRFMKYYSFILGHFIFWMMVLLIPTFLGYIDHVAMILLGMVENVCSAYTLKYLFRRRRPYEALEGVKILDQPKDPSFPSSHVQNCSFFVFTLSTIWPFTLIPLLFILVILAVSRIYVGAHYPSDVIAGIFLGLIFTFIYLLWLYPLAQFFYSLFKTLLPVLP